MFKYLMNVYRELGKVNIRKAILIELPGLIKFLVYYEENMYFVSLIYFLSYLCHKHKFYTDCFSRSGIHIIYHISTMES